MPHCKIEITKNLTPGDNYIQLMKEVANAMNISVMNFAKTALLAGLL
jgi:hypothetical protein